MEALISKALIDSNISNDEFVLKNNVLEEYDKMKEEIKNLKILIGWLKISVYLQNNASILFESVKKYRK